MAVSIKIDQSGAPAGVGGKAREDLQTGLPVTLTAVGGPFAAYLWEVIDRPVNNAMTGQATSTLATPSASVSVLTPIDVLGTYKVRLSVDSGSGVGATQDDITEITFYAFPTGNPLNTDPAELPRRAPAFREKGEHNVDDTVFPLGNTRGWAQEKDRDDRVIDRMYRNKAWARADVALTGVGATLNPSQVENVQSVTRIGIGQVDVVFVRPVTSAIYQVAGTSTGPIGGALAIPTRLVTGFTIERANPGGVLIDADFSFVVFWNPISS